MANARYEAPCERSGQEELKVYELTWKITAGLVSLKASFGRGCIG